MHSIDRLLTPTSVSLAEYQTPVRFQGIRKTCWAFAALAAIEAAYKRDYNLTLTLAPEYLCSVLTTAILFHPNESDLEYTGSFGCSARRVKP